MSDRAEVKLTILEAVVKGYYECSFAVRVGDKFVIKQIVQIQLQWSFSSYLSEALATTV